MGKGINEASGFRSKAPDGAVPIKIGMQSVPLIQIARIKNPRQLNG
jgi:hypothetical protein